MDKNTKIILGIIAVIVLIIIVNNLNEVQNAQTYAITPTAFGKWGAATFQWIKVAFWGLLGYKVLQSGALDNTVTATGNLASGLASIPPIVWVALVIVILLLLFKKK